MTRIVAFPAFKKKDNPYQVLLYNAIQARHETIVDEFSCKNILFKKYDIIHVHWPESDKLKKNILKAITYISIFNALLQIAKWKGAKLVWTVHNLKPHETKFPALEAFHFWVFTTMTDGFTVMNTATIEKIILHYPSLKNKPYKIIPHGHYKNWYSDTVTRAAARSFFNLSQTDHVFLTLGEIRPYKGLEALIENLKQSPHQSYKLIIAGTAGKEGLHYKEKIESLSRTDKRIIFHPGFVADELLQYYFNAADVVMLPYTSLLNSGVLLLALSFNKTIALPCFDTVSELEQTYKDWIFTYNSFDKCVFCNALNKAKKNAGKSIDMNTSNWDLIAFKTMNFYKSLY